MGGYAFIIPVEVDKSLLQPQPMKKNLFDKLLSRQRYSEPQKYDYGDTIMVELPADKLDQMSINFSRFLLDTLKEPTEASRRILEYLEIGVVTVYTRGEIEKESGNETWYIQMTFSGCAGMAEISAMLCSHWAELWFQQQKKDIVDNILAPAGFNPIIDAGITNNFPAFYPTEDYGYAAYDESPGGEYHFDIDVSSYNEDEEGDNLLKEMEGKYLDEMKSSTCKCQLCVDIL